MLSIYLWSHNHEDHPIPTPLVVISKGAITFTLEEGLYLHGGSSSQDSWSPLTDPLLAELLEIYENLIITVVSTTYKAIY